MPREPGHVGDSRVRDDQADTLVSLDERGKLVGDRRQPSAAVDEHGNLPLDGEGEDRSETDVADGEPLRAWVQL